MPVKYVLMATLEVAPETQLSIYQEVEARYKHKSVLKCDLLYLFIKA